MSADAVEMGAQFLRQAPTRQVARDLCGLLFELSALDRLKAVTVLEDTVDHPERSVLFYAYRQVRGRPWLAEPIRDILRHITLGLTEAAQVDRLMDARIQAMAEEDRRFIRDLPPESEPDFIQRIEDAAADRMLVLCALRNGLAAHVGGYAPQVVADYVRFSLPDAMRMSHAELSAVIQTSVREHVGGPSGLMVSVEPLGQGGVDYDERMAWLLGTLIVESEDGDVDIPSLDARMETIASGWKSEETSWLLGIDQLTHQLLTIDENALLALIEAETNRTLSLAMLGMPPAPVRRLMEVMEPRARVSFFDMIDGYGQEEFSFFTRDDVLKSREKVLTAIAKVRFG